MDPAKLNQDVKPVAPGVAVPAGTLLGVTRPAHVIDGFKDLPIGTYSITASMDSVPKVVGTGTTSARGSTEAELKVGLLRGLARSGFGCVGGRAAIDTLVPTALGRRQWSSCPSGHAVVLRN